MYRYLITVGLVLLGSNAVRAADRVIAFPQNERYGYVVRHDSTRTPSSWVDFVRLPSYEGNDTALTVLRSDQSQYPPSMCSSDAVSYLKPNGDSAYLVVMRFETPDRLDTIIACLTGRGYLSHYGGSFQFPDPRGLTAMTDGYFRLGDSLLFWKPFGCDRIDPIAWGRIEADGMLAILGGRSATSVPKPISDFSELLCRSEYCVDRNDPFGLPGTLFMRYDTEADSFATLDSVAVMCLNATRRSRQDSIWCIAHGEDSYDENLCRVVNGRLIPVTDLKYPLKVSAFRLYADSVVIDTIECCGGGVAH